MIDQLDGTLWNFFEVVYRRHRLAGKGSDSPRNFRVQIRHLERMLGRPPLLDDLNDDTILDLMRRRLDEGHARATANKVHAHLTAIWNFAARKGLTGNRWPTVKRFSEPERTPQAWSESQLRNLFAACARVSGQICGLPAGEWHLCHHLVLWYSAERLRASLLIRLDDLDLRTGWFRIRAETRKNQTRDLMRRLPQESLPLFRRFVERDPERELLFPRDCCYATLFNRYRKIVRAAGLPCGRTSMYHRMRRSAISHFRAMGGDAVALADHSNPRITRKNYEDPTIVVEQQAADLLFRPWESGGDDGPRAA